MEREAKRLDAIRRYREAERRQKKGPAEAATSPSHGSSNPHKDQNMDDASTEFGGPARPFRGYHDAFQRLETPIDRVLGFAKVQEMLGVFYSEGKDETFRSEMAGLMLFIAAETRHAAFALESQWLGSHNAGCDAQHAEAGR